MDTPITHRNLLKAVGGGLAAMAVSGCSGTSGQLASQKSAKTSEVRLSYPYGCRLIDAHVHVFANPKIRNTAKASFFLTTEQQIEIMNRLGVEKAVILPFASVEAPGEHQSIGEVLSICDKFPGRFIPFCNLDPRLPKHLDKIEVDDYVFRLTQYKELGCKGLGEFTGRIRWDDKCMLLLLKACQMVGFSVTFHTMSPDYASDKYDNYGVLDDIGLPGLEKVLQKFPNLKLFGHSPAFWSEISGNVTSEQKNIYATGPVTKGGAVPRLMRRYLNLYGDLSAKSALNALTRDPEHAYGFIDEFQNRLLFGMDYCSLNDKHDLAGWLQTAVNEGHITKQAFEKIAWKNINEILSLGIS